MNHERYEEADDSRFQQVEDNEYNSLGALEVAKHSIESQFTAIKKAIHDTHAWPLELGSSSIKRPPENRLYEFRQDIQSPEPANERLASLLCEQYEVDSETPLDESKAPEIYRAASYLSYDQSLPKFGVVRHGAVDVLNSLRVFRTSNRELFLVTESFQRVELLKDGSTRRKDFATTSFSVFLKEAEGPRGDEVELLSLAADKSSQE